MPLLLTMLIIPMILTGGKGSLTDIRGIDEATKIASFSEISREDYFFTQFRVIVTYIRLLFIPINQNLDYDYPVYHSFLDLEVLLSFLFLVLLFGLGVYLYLRSRSTIHHSPFTIHCLRLASFGIFWFFITLSVESSIIPIRDVIFEHRVYLPSIGFFIALMSAIEITKERLKKRINITDKAFVSVLVLIVIILSITAYARNHVWKDKIRLWEDVVRKSPDKARPHNSLGVAYEEQGRLDEAFNEYQVALKLDPDHPLAYYNLGNVYFAQGQYNEAVREYQTSLRLDPYNAPAHNNLGNSYLQLGRLDEAVREFQTALEIDPDFTKARFNLEFVYSLERTGVK